jgi:hypothetical protein
MTKKLGEKSRYKHNRIPLPQVFLSAGVPYATLNPHIAQHGRKENAKKKGDLPALQREKKGGRSASLETSTSTATTATVISATKRQKGTFPCTGTEWGEKVCTRIFSSSLGIL